MESQLLYCEISHVALDKQKGYFDLHLSGIRGLISHRQIWRSLMRSIFKRIIAFSAFLWKRLKDDNCPEIAGALSYATLFALVPVIAAVLGILSAFPVFQKWRSSVTDFLFTNFVPGAARAVQGYLTQFAEHAMQTTAVGILVLLLSVLMVMANIEAAYNRIWRVITPRRKIARFLMYWTALSLGPLVVVAALTISSYLFAMPLISQADAEWGLRTRLLSLLPFFITWITLAGSYVVIPNRTQPLRPAVWGGLLAALLFELAKHGFAYYLSQLPSYQEIYGALSIIPIFLLWIYLCWVMVLLGATFAASLADFDYPPHSYLLKGNEFVGLLIILDHFAEAQRTGKDLHSNELRQREGFLTEELVTRYLIDLQKIGVLQRTEQASWVMTRTLSSITLLELYEAGQYRWPAKLSDSTLAMITPSHPRIAELFARGEKFLHSLFSCPLSDIFALSKKEDLAQINQAIV